MQKMLPSYGVGLRENLGLSYSLICLLNGEVSVVFVSKGLVTRPFDDPSQRRVGYASFRQSLAAYRFLTVAAGQLWANLSRCVGLSRRGRVGANLFASGDAPTGGVGVADAVVILHGPCVLQTSDTPGQWLVWACHCRIPRSWGCRARRGCKREGSSAPRRLSRRRRGCPPS